MNNLSGIRNYMFAHSRNGSGFLDGSSLFMIGEDELPVPSSLPLPGLDDKCWRYGFISYDFKNSIEALASVNPKYFACPDYYFNCPRHVFRNRGRGWEDLHPAPGKNAVNVSSLLRVLTDLQADQENKTGIRIKARFSKMEYIAAVKEIKKKIREGEIYEMNFCQEFYAEDVELDAVDLFRRLDKYSPAPFSFLMRMGDTYLISSSPERFLKKTGRQLLSQPIKGTRRRGKSEDEDHALRKELKEDEKERSENVMIVDLVRNDLSRIAERGSVKVDELFGIYSFEQVHQMISSVSCTLKAETSFTEILRASFPMGSMTGAPKIRAMELIERYERNSRGHYSGAAGFLSPDGDFDFSVVIRSLVYDETRRYLSFMAGSAITDKSDPEQEYEECLLKARGLLIALGATLE